tara:strand:+ start:5359 stop:7326 length:1968 start_codon:yes stop_codon:yes gene_type:complete
MAKLGISTGSSPNDGTGDSLIDGAVKINSNFNEIYNLIGDGSTLAAPVTSVTAGAGINLSGSTGSVTITNTGIANTNNLRTDFLEVSGISTLTGNVNFGGNAIFGNDDQIQLGDSQELSLQYNSSDSAAIISSGGNPTDIKATAVRLKSNSDENMIIASTNGAVDLYYDNSKKLETTTHGAKVTGVCSATSFIGDGSALTGISAGTGNTTNVSTNSLVVVGVATVGAGTSTNGVEAPALTLSHNNPTVVSTAGTLGQIKQIGSQPYYYDGTDWRALFLIAGISTANLADTDWDNTMIRLNFDQTDIGSLVNLKDNVAPSSTSTIDLVSSPVKYGTKSARYPANNSGIRFDQDNSGSVRYSFEGPWTIEGWFFFDGAQLTTNTTTVSATKLFANYNSATGTGTNWDIGVYFSGSGSGDSAIYNFYWHNRASSNTSSGQAGNSATGFILLQTAKSNFCDNAWHHIAITRNSSNGAIKFFLDGQLSSLTASNQLIENDINDSTNKEFSIGYHSHSNVGTGWFDGNIDDIRVSNIERYTTAFTPPSSALPITGSTTTVITPPDSKIGELALGNTPTWTGTPGVTPTRVAAGHYRTTYATAYSNATDYTIQVSMNDYTPVTTAVGIGVSRFTTHTDFYVNRVSDGATIDTGSIAIDLYKK